jgi:hypothetical protein
MLCLVSLRPPGRKCDGSTRRDFLTVGRPVSVLEELL